MTRAFLRPDDVRNLVSEHLGTDRRTVGLDRLAGGSKKGVYRLRLDDQATAILYVWASDENYWPSSPSVHDDPFTDASGATCSPSTTPPARTRGCGHRSC